MTVMGFNISKRSTSMYMYKTFIVEESLTFSCTKYKPS